MTKNKNKRKEKKKVIDVKSSFEVVGTTTMGIGINQVK
jgi:hypothetical protein